MSLIVSSIVEVSMNNVALWISLDVQDWTAEIVIIVGNVLEKKSDEANLPTILGNNFGGYKQPSRV